MSHQPPLYVVLDFLLHELVLIILTHVVKSQAQRTEAVDGSNERLQHADEELDPPLLKKSPLQTILKKFSVQRNHLFSKGTTPFSLENMIQWLKIRSHVFPDLKQLLNVGLLCGLGHIVPVYLLFFHPK